MTPEITPSDIELAKARIKAGYPDTQTVALLVRRGVEAAVAAQLLSHLRAGQSIHAGAVTPHSMRRAVPQKRPQGPEKDRASSPEQSVRLSTSKTASSFLLRNVWALVAFIPLLLLVYVVVRFSVPVPFWDQWEMVALLQKNYQGHLAFSDFWAQHNEHRPLFPRLIMLGLARLTHWDIRYELAANVALAFGLFAVLVWQVWQTGRELGVSGMRWLVPALSLIVFSLSQYENWLWGWQIQMLLNVLAVSGGIVMLANCGWTWMGSMGAAVLGVVATYSFANGMLFWPIGFGVLLMVIRDRERRVVLAGLWVLLAVLVAGSYFCDYQKPAEHPQLSLIFTMPLTYAAYVLKYVGSICAEGVGGGFALVFGLAGLVTLVWTVCGLLRLRRADLKALTPYLGLSAYSLGSAMVTGLGRVGFGSDQALSSRYCTTTVPFWASLVVSLFLLTRAGRPTSEAGGESKRASRVDRIRWFLSWAVLGVTLAVLALSSLGAVDGAAETSRKRSSGRDALLKWAANSKAGPDYKRIGLLYPKPGVVVERAPVLVKLRLSLFRNYTNSVAGD